MAKEDALKWIAEQTAAISEHPYVFSCTWIAKDIGESVYRVRKYMKELEKEGYVKKDHEGGFSDWSGSIYCIHGYSLAEKGFNTSYYREKEKEELEWWGKALKEI